MKTTILGVDVDAVTKKEALGTLLKFLNGDKNHTLFTPNPEFVLLAQDDWEFKDILNTGDLVVPDGVGIVIASKFNEIKIKERVAGCDLVFSLFDAVKGTRTVYLLGGKPGVAEKAKINMESKFSGLKVVGFHDGYFEAKEERSIIKEIRELSPDILLVGTGFPKQEKWIFKYKNKIPVKLTAGIGGSIDIMAGTVKRAPAVMRALGLEWLWRLLLQPKRILRIYKLPLFIIKVIQNKNK